MPSDRSGAKGDFEGGHRTTTDITVDYEAREEVAAA